MTNAPQEQDTWEDLKALVSEAQAGSPTAFEALVDRTENLVRKLAYPIVGEDLLKDALQETYLLVFRNIHQLREAGAFIPWLSRMSLHACYELAKRHRPVETFEEQSTSADHSDRVVDRLTLQQALNRLERADRDLLILRELIGLSYEDLAYALRIPTGTVKSRLSKARACLKDRLETKPWSRWASPS